LTSVVVIGAKQKWIWRMDRNFTGLYGEWWL